MKIDTLIRENIRALKPYHSARQDFLSGLLLDANENAFGSVLSIDGLALNRYPDPYQRKLRALIAKMNGLEVDNIFVGVGSDEVIDLLVRIFCEPKKDSVVLLEPTYGMYRVAASVQDIQTRSCLLTENFQINLQSVKEVVDTSTKIIFCCSPNNPTGNLLHAEDIVALCSFGIIVIVDEAYIDFAQSKSLCQNIKSYPNLIVLRTLSKAWGLAGVRLGYCIANSDIIFYLMKVKLPYNINLLTSRTGLQALKKKDKVRKTIRAIIKERKWLVKELSKLSCIKQVFPSDANFILVRCEDADELYQSLVKKDIIIRNRSTEPRLNNCLRITVGTRKENVALLSAMKDFCL